MSFFRNWFLLCAAITLTSCSATEEERCLNYCTDEARTLLSQAQAALDNAQEHESKTTDAINALLDRARENEAQTREVLRFSQERLDELRELRALECLCEPTPTNDLPNGFFIEWTVPPAP